MVPVKETVITLLITVSHLSIGSKVLQLSIEQIIALTNLQ